MVAVASVNPADIKAGGGAPYSTGLDGAGIVIGVCGGDVAACLGKGSHGMDHSERCDRIDPNSVHSESTLWSKKALSSRFQRRLVLKSP